MPVPANTQQQQFIDQVVQHGIDNGFSAAQIFTVVEIGYIESSWDRT